MYGPRMTPWTPATDRYKATVVCPRGGGAGGGWGGGGGGGTMTGTAMTGSCVDQLQKTSPEMDVTDSCRSFLLSRLKAAEQMNDRLREDARNSAAAAAAAAAGSSRLRSVKGPGDINVDLAIEQLRAQVASLLDADIGVIRHLLTVNEQMEELRWQRKFGEGPTTWTPSTLLSESCTADMESADFDPDMDPLDPRDPRLSDVRRHVVNGCYGDDVTDDVFQNDETAAARLPPTSNNACVSSELRFKVTPSGLEANSPDRVSRSKVEVMVGDPRNADDSRTSKVEIKVNGKKAGGEGGTAISSRPQVKVKGLDEINERLKTAKVEFKVDGGAKVDDTKASTSQVQIRFLVNSDEVRVQGQSDDEGHSKGSSATESLPQTAVTQYSQKAPYSSRDAKRSYGPISKQRVANEANRETKPEHIPQLRILNLGQGMRGVQAGNTTPGKVKVTPFTVVAGDENEDGDTLVVHL